MVYLLSCRGSGVGVLFGMVTSLGLVDPEINSVCGINFHVQM